MRTAVLSDIHSNLEALTQVLKTAGTVDEYLCLGDIVGYGANPIEVIRLLRQHKLRAVRGNHDDAVLTGIAEGFNPIAAAAVEWTGNNISREGLDFLEHLPIQLDIELEGTRIHMVHGSPERPLEEYVYVDEPRDRLRSFLQMTNSNLLLLGHTHIPMKIELDGGRILNPGSVGQPRDGDPRASYALLETGDGEIKTSIIRVGYDVAQAAKKILGAGLPSFDAERLLLGL